MSDKFVREIRVFKFEHRANRKTRTWKTRPIWSKKFEMSEMSEFLTWRRCKGIFQTTRKIINIEKDGEERGTPQVILPVAKIGLLANWPVCHGIVVYWRDARKTS